MMMVMMVYIIILFNSIDCAVHPLKITPPFNWPYFTGLKVIGRCEWRNWKKG